MGTFPYMHVFFYFLKAYHYNNKLITSIQMCGHRNLGYYFVPRILYRLSHKQSPSHIAERYVLASSLEQLSSTHLESKPVLAIALLARMKADHAKIIKFVDASYSSVSCT